MIHYFLEGNLNFDYRDSWQKYAPNSEIIHWNFSKLPVDKYPELKHLVDKKMYSPLSDFIRWWSVYEYGGIYLDFDVELIAPINDLLQLKSFVCIEGKDNDGLVWANGAVSGGQKGSKHHAIILENYLDVIKGKKSYPNTIEVACGPYMLTDYVESLKGDKLSDVDLHRIRKYGDLITLPKEYFYPFYYNELFTKECITKNTRGIHWYKASWK